MTKIFHEDIKIEEKTLEMEKEKDKTALQKIISKKGF